MTIPTLSAILAAASPAFAADLARLETAPRSFQSTHVIDDVEVSFCGNVQKANGRTYRSYDIEIELDDDGAQSLSETTDGIYSLSLSLMDSARRLRKQSEKADAITAAGGTVGDMFVLPALLAPLLAAPLPRTEYDAACKAGDDDILTFDIAQADELPIAA